MARKLNKLFFLLLGFMLACTVGSAQEEDQERYSDKEYKDKAQFEKFYKRRQQVAAWQISQLKNGALVVRLKTNHLLINSLIKQGDASLAKEKELEMDAVNLNTIRAYLFNFNFCKVYFMYSGSSDSLLNGTRNNIFVDSSLQVNPAITMTETFYLLAERDYAYNSSIGFVPEDSARFVKEKGNGVKEMAVVVKNKYGHQLKKPFPYDSPDRPGLKIENSIMHIVIKGVSYPFIIGSFGSSNKKTKGTNHNGPANLFIPKYLTYERLTLAISNFNQALINYYKAGSFAGNNSDPELKPFLY